METHDGGSTAGAGDLTPKQRKLIDELAERVAALPADRREALLQTLEGAMLADDLRRAIADSGLTPYAIAKQAEIRPEVVTRFVNGERDLYLETAGKIAAVLGLALRPVREPATKPKPRQPPAPKAGRSRSSEPAKGKPPRKTPGAGE